MGQNFDLLIIGGGLTGMAAARRARQAGLSCLVVADSPGSLPYTSGAIDLLAVYPTETKRYRAEPWEALSELIEQEPTHPYGRAGLARVKASMTDFLGYLKNSSLAYYFKAESNLQIVTAAGTLKPTYAVPQTMKANVEALEKRLPTLIVGFNGLVDFSPEQVVCNLQDRWSGLRPLRLDLCTLLDPARRITQSALRDAFERPGFRKQLIERIGPELGAARYLGLPAVLGSHGQAEVLSDLAEGLGVEVFEIPLVSPSLPGARLRNLLMEDLFQSGVTYWAGAPIETLGFENGRIAWALRAPRQGRGGTERIHPKHVLLATGRFFGGGLVADRHRVTEPLANLPIESPANRDDWHMNTFLGAPGHPINRVGICVDRELRPLDKEGNVLYENLHAAGAILARHDWVREKSGAGICVATAYAAVDSIVEQQTKNVAGDRS